MKALVGAFNQEKALVGAFSVIVQPVVEPMEHFTALPKVLGDKYMTDYQLKTPESSHSEYDQYSNAMMLHEFVTFAYRW